MMRTTQIQPFYIYIHILMISPSVSLYHTSIMFRLRQSIGFWSFWTLILRFVLQLQPLNSSEENHMRRRMYAEVRQGHTRLALVRDLAYGWPSAGIHVNRTGKALAKGNAGGVTGVIKAFCDQVAGLVGFFRATGWIRGTLSGKWSDMSEGLGEKPSIVANRNNCSTKSWLGIFSSNPGCENNAHPTQFEATSTRDLLQQQWKGWKRDTDCWESWDCSHPLSKLHWYRNHPYSNQVGHRTPNFRPTCSNKIAHWDLSTKAVQEASSLYAIVTLTSKDKAM